jgi:hypothetical protein
MRMVAQTYVIRKIEDADRAKYGRRIANAEARNDPEEAQFWKDALAQWETEQGEERERMVCPVCQSSWLTPTSSGTSRPHRRSDIEHPNWDKVRQLRKEIQTLQAELDRVLEGLEP